MCALFLHINTSQLLHLRHQLRPMISNDHMEEHKLVTHHPGPLSG